MYTMTDFNRCYLSGETHENCATLAKFSNLGTTTSSNIALKKAPIPLTRRWDFIEVPEDGYYDIIFYPFFITNVYRIDKPYYFYHEILGGIDRYAQSAVITDNAGNVIDRSNYEVRNINGKIYIYHNLVNNKSKYYFVVFVKEVRVHSDPNIPGVINYGFRELLTANKVLREREAVAAMRSNEYYVDIADDHIRLYTSPGYYYISYDYANLIYFQFNASSRQQWWMCARHFAYLNEASDTVFSTRQNYLSEDFYPHFISSSVVGMNFIVEKDISMDDNNVLFLSSFPVYYTFLEYPIIDTDLNRRLPIKSIDPYSGAVEINTDDLKSPKSVFNLSYYIRQEHVVLDKPKLIFSEENYLNFNPVYRPVENDATMSNTYLLDKYVVTYLRKNSEDGEKIHQAIFEVGNRAGVQDFYLTETFPNDPYISELLDSYGFLSYSFFKSQLSTIASPNFSGSVLILGISLVHNSTDPPVAIEDNVKDMRQLGGGLAEEYLEDAIDATRESKYYWDLQPLDGDMLPAMTNFFLFIPEQLLTFFTPDDIMIKVNKHSAAGSFATMVRTDSLNLYHGTKLYISKTFTTEDTFNEYWEEEGAYFTEGLFYPHPVILGRPQNPTTIEYSIGKKVLFVLLPDTSEGYYEDRIGTIKTGIAISSDLSGLGILDGIPIFSEITLEINDELQETISNIYATLSSVAYDSYQTYGGKITLWYRVV